ncbi:MAG: hypothetical protein H0V66_02750 [Bdellovibrionales bacterium]|nr:hypothetical protein [Bdellovibrionales bacterium]
MKIIMALLTGLVLMSCSSRNETWDAGAQRQEAHEVQSREETQDRVREQFPSGIRNF